MFPQTQSSLSAATPDDKKMRARHNPIRILLLFGALTVMGAVILAARSKTEQPSINKSLQPAPTPDQNQTANWKTYTNSGYSYQIN